MKIVLFLALTVALLAPASGAGLELRDDAGNPVRLAAPAKRIVALAPHVAENLFAAGAGDRVVATVEYADYPPAARKLPRVGNYARFDLEAIAALKPDLVVAWETGNPKAQVDKLRALGIPVFLSQPNRIDDVPGQLELMGRLAGTSAIADAEAAEFRRRLAALRAAQAGKPAVRVFYQIWKSPLMTVGGPQIISDMIALCGGENVFAGIAQMSPTVSLEAVLAADPEAIVASGMSDARPDWLDDWKQWTRLTAVRRGNLFFVNPDIMQRHTPRILDGAAQLCDRLDAARRNRPGR